MRAAGRRSPGTPGSRLPRGRCSRPATPWRKGARNPEPGGGGMDIYHIWCDLRPGVRDTTLAGPV
ncbi:protein of unknown function [Rhodovastum atsumiense]|nr:protein of unknown function [Rhodovastum atsumiense]